MGTPLDPPPAPDQPAPSRSRLSRGLYGAAGGVALALGVLGVFLPGLPTTPFVLLAAACFARASPRVYGWLLGHRLFGPLVRDWQHHRSLTRRTKAVAVGSMGVMVALSVFGVFAGRPLAQAGLVALGGIGAFVVLRIPTRPRPGAD